MSGYAPTPDHPASERPSEDGAEREMLRRLVASSPDAMLVVQDRLIRYDNQALYLSPEDDRIGHVFAERAAEAEQPAIWAKLDAVQAGELPEARVEFESQVTGRILEAILRPATYEGAPAVAVYMRDVSERARLARSMEAQTRELAETVEELSLYRAMVEHSRDSILLVQDGVIEMGNEALREPDAPSIVGRRVRDLFRRETIDGWREDTRRILAGELESAHWEYRVPTSRPPGYRTVEAIARRIDYRERPALLVTTRDVSERKAVEVQLEEMTRTDALTGIPNRRAFYEALAYWRDEAARSNARHALCYVDLDGFKTVNDGHGHRAGDELLVEIAHRFRDTVRRTDILARLGGDEFAVLLPATDEDGAHEVADKLLADVHAAAAAYPTVSASIGVTTFRAGDDPDEVISRADRAMYRVKTARRAAS